MTRAKPEPMQVVKQRRDAALRALVSGVPYIRFLGIEFDRRGDEMRDGGLYFELEPWKAQLFRVRITPL